jgi:hypothetical protein
MAGIHTSKDIPYTVYCLQVLNLLAPDYFDATWLSKVSPVVGGDNKRLKANNVRKVVGSTIDYLKDLAGVQLHQFPLPDVNQVSHEYPVPRYCSWETGTAPFA